jgi:hypothetical protein
MAIFKKIQILGFFFCLIILCSESAFSQDISFNNRLYFRFDSQKSVIPGFHLSLKPYKLSEIENFRDSINCKESEYRKGTNFNLKFDPIINSQAIYDKKMQEIYTDFGIGTAISTNFSNRIFLDISAYGSLQKIPYDKKQFADSFGIVQAVGKYISKTGIGYFSVPFSGRLAYEPNKIFTVEIGKSTQFFGMGYRSLFLSDNSGAKPYFSVEAEIWRIKYLWLCMKLSDFNITGTGLPDKLFDKYAFMHYFSINLTKRINFDLFEAIISSPQTDYGNQGINVAYLNPVIFYRPAEFNEGSSGNSLLGIGLNYRLFKSLFLYSQIIIDEFVLSKITAQTGWWGNKQGIQAGIKWFNPFSVANSLVGAEFNAVRPYTYSHYYRNINYGDMHQALADPAGANFEEFVFYGKKSFEKISFGGKIIASEKGLDTDTVSCGQDIYKSYELRKQDFGNRILQGKLNKEFLFDFSVSYSLNPRSETDFFAGIQFDKTSVLGQNDTDFYFYFGIKSIFFNQKFTEK